MINADREGEINMQAGKKKKQFILNGLFLSHPDRKSEKCLSRARINDARI